MAFLLFTAALLLVGGVFSLMHGIIKPAVDWLSPEPPSTGHRAWALLVEEGERTEREILTMQQSRPPHRAKRDGELAFQRALAQQYAKGAEKRRLRAAIAEHERKPKPPRYLP